MNVALDWISVCIKMRWKMFVKFGLSFDLLMDCMLISGEAIVNRLLEEVELEWWFDQDIDDEREEDEEGKGGSEV
ncbi:hypothetical protein Tco_0127355 [Tanacetum coccineum]